MARLVNKLPRTNSTRLMYLTTYRCPHAVWLAILSPRVRCTVHLLAFAYCFCKFHFRIDSQAPEVLNTYTRTELLRLGLPALSLNPEIHIFGALIFVPSVSAGRGGGVASVYSVLNQSALFAKRRLSSINDIASFLLPSYSVESPSFIRYSLQNP